MSGLIESDRHFWLPDQLLIDQSMALERAEAVLLQFVQKKGTNWSLLCQKKQMIFIDFRV